jgi:hypothetical protein
VNNWAYENLERVFAWVGRLGLPLIIGAWMTVFAGMIGMVLVLRKRRLRGKLMPALAVGIASLAAHLLDYFGTLRITSNLAAEANPIWRIVLDRLGLSAAHWYGLTGKIILAVLSFEFFTYYLIGREKLMPPQARDFYDFWRNFGWSVRSSERLVNFFAFLFALIGPFCFYVAFLNSISDSDLYGRMPAMPVMLFIYIFILTIVYLYGNYRSYRKHAARKPLNNSSAPL